MKCLIIATIALLCANFSHAQSCNGLSVPGKQIPVYAVLQNNLSGGYDTLCWYMNRQEVIDYVATHSGGSSLSIGSPITNSTPQQGLYVDADGNLGQSAQLNVDPTNDNIAMISNDGSIGIGVDGQNQMVFTIGALVLNTGTDAQITLPPADQIPQMGDVIKANGDGTTSWTNSHIDMTTAHDTSFALPPNVWFIAFGASPTQAEVINIGTTPGGSDILSAYAILPGSYNPTNIMNFFSKTDTTTIYISGAHKSVNYQILKQ